MFAFFKYLYYNTCY